MSILSVLSDAWRQRKTLGDQAKNRELAAFLPAALEIQETPAHPLAHIVVWTLISLIVLLIIWASFGEVNIVASAEGKIIPSSRVKQIQPLEKAFVKRILVHEGQSVSKGQALIELDGTLTLADEKRLNNELHSAQLMLSVYQAMLTLLDKPFEQHKAIEFATVELTMIADVSPQQQSLHQRLLWQQWQQYKAQLMTLRSTLLKTQAEQEVTQAMISKLKQVLPLIKRRTQSVKDLHSKKFASETDYLKLEQERIQLAQDYAAEQHRLKQLQAVEMEVEQQLKGLTAQTKTRQLIDLTETQRQIATLKEELAKAHDRHKKKILYAPVSGEVQNLTVNTVGGVVLEAQQLMLIVPDEEALEVEVFLENKDIGFVHEGMSAEIKIHTFPFTKYGVIDGEVVTLSDDAQADENRGLIYGMHLLMKKSTIEVNGKVVKLMPGMAVTAEVQTGKRRIMEFFMAPLLRYKQESIRER